MTRERLLKHIDGLLQACEGASDKRPDPFLPFNGALTLMTSFYGVQSPQVQALVSRRKELYSQKTGSERTWGYDLMGSVRGALQNLRAEIEAGLVPSFEKRITSDVLSDFVLLAREVLQQPGDNHKNVAAVLAAAAYEDTLRRMAGGSRADLEDVIASLKASGALVAPQLGIALSLLNFRNRALHANWESIDRSGVEPVLAFVQELLLKRFGAEAAL